MSFNSEEDASINHRDLIFLLAIAGRIDAQSRILAKKLNDDRYIYHAYAVLDSLSSTYSMFKYFFEIFVARNDPKLMQQFLSSPAGIAAVTVEALFLVSFAFLASCFDKEKGEGDRVKKFIATAWPYFRTTMKGLKNAYKGWKSVIQLMNLGGVDLKFLIIPIGLTLGVLAAANRFALQYLIEKRKNMMEENKALLVGNEDQPINQELYKLRLKEIQGQEYSERMYGFICVTMGGFIDGIYLYMGAVSLAMLSPPALIALSVISGLYTLACVISRIYEEYDYQLQLFARQTNCKLTLLAALMKFNYEALLGAQSKANNENEITSLKNELIISMSEFTELRMLLKKQITHSYLTAALLGMKHGLFAYGVFTSLLFMISSVFLVSFPPALLITIIVSGLVLMAAFTAYTTHSHYLHLQRQKEDNDEPYVQLIDIQKKLDLADTKDLPKESFNKTLNEGKNPKASPQFFFQEWLELGRSFFSGFTKGNNFANFMETPFQNNDPQEHEHDSFSIMYMLQMANAALFAIVLTLRAFARGLGRTPLNQLPKIVREQPPAATVENSLSLTQTELDGESGEVAKPGSLNRNSFFSNGLSSSPTTTNRSSPSPVIPNDLNDLSIVQGLD